MPQRSELDVPVVTRAEVLTAAEARGLDVLEHPVGLVRVPLQQLSEVIRLMEEFSLVVLGMDGLLLAGEMTIPLEDFVADLGAIAGPWGERVKESAHEASAIAAHWHEGPSHIELTLDGLDD